MIKSWSFSTRNKCVENSTSTTIEISRPNNIIKELYSNIEIQSRIKTRYTDIQTKEFSYEINPRATKLAMIYMYN